MAEGKNDNNIDIPILCMDAVSSVKMKFIAEMKKIDEEMSKLSCDIMRLYNQSSTIHAEMASASESMERQSSPNGQGNWDSLASSPLVKGKGENKTLKLQFDVSEYDRTEVKVKVQDEKLVVSASHEDRSDTGSVLRQFYKEFKFPKGVDPATVISTLSKDGVLTVQAPLPQLAVTGNSESSPKILEQK